MKDMIFKGRKKVLYGEENFLFKLTSSQVKEIRELSLTNKYTQKELSDKYNIGVRQIRRIITNRSRRIKRNI